MGTKPQGVIATFSDPSGNVTAHAADFDKSRPGGFKTIEAQEQRARVRLAHAVVKAYCSDLIVKALGTYECEQLLRKLTGEQKCVVSIVPVGYDED